jgi:hypothetical protein
MNPDQDLQRRVAELTRGLQATEQALLDERAAGRNAFVMAAPAHEVARAWERGGDLTPEMAVLVAAHRATTPSPTPPTHVVVAVDELDRLRAIEAAYVDAFGEYSPEHRNLFKGYISGVDGAL